MKTTAQIKNNQKGFTLIELLVVIGILAILLAITLIAINPAQQFQQARNTQRKSDVNTILNAINQYMSDTANNGTPPAGIPTGEIADAKLIGKGTDSVNLCVLVPKYVAAIPTDPQSTVDPLDEAACTDATNTSDTGYQVVQTSNGRITVIAPNTEGLPEDISVTR